MLYDVLITVEEVGCSSDWLCLESVTAFWNVLDVGWMDWILPAE